MLEMTISVYVVTDFAAYQSSWKQKQTCHQVVRTSSWLVSYSRELCNKNVSSRLHIRWS